MCDASEAVRWLVETGHLYAVAGEHAKALAEAQAGDERQRFLDEAAMRFAQALETASVDATHPASMAKYAYDRAEALLAERERRRRPAAMSPEELELLKAEAEEGQAPVVPPDEPDEPGDAADDGAPPEDDGVTF